MPSEREGTLHAWSRILVAGGRTAVGRALLDALRAAGCRQVFSEAADLTRADAVAALFDDARPEFVFLVAGKSGGIRANQQRPAELMLDNLLVTAHVVEQARRAGVRKLLYLASSCAYPKHASQPMSPAALTTGSLEPTSEAYATAKLAGWKLCQAYRQQYGVAFVTAFPANPFGPYDDFSPDGGHVLPALLRRLHDARRAGAEQVTLWGTGAPRREFLYVRDLADACLFVMQHYDGAEPINLGSGFETTIAAAAREVADVVGYGGRLEFDPRLPDGAPRKALDASRLFALGWRPATPFRTALEETYTWFLERQDAEDCNDGRTAVSVPLPHSAPGGSGRPRLPE